MASDGLRQLLIVEDDQDFARTLERALRGWGFVAHIARSGEDALALMQQFQPDYVLLDLNLGGKPGLNLIRPLLEIHPGARVVVLTGHASIATAVNALKVGAFDYLTKPTTINSIVISLNGSGDPAGQSDPPSDLMTVGSLEWEYIQRTLLDNGGNISATARALKMHRRTLQRKLGKKRDTP